MRLKIISAGDPVLRTTAQPLSKKQITSPHIQTLIEYMRETVRDAPGVGLAAPQIGESLQLAVIEDRAEYHKSLTPAEMKERGRKEVPFHVLVNPVIELLTDPSESFYEGCLSVPGFLAHVSRAKEVRVQCLDHKGEQQTITASGWHARILQHEIDHLNGVLYVDRMQSRTFSTLENYTRHGKSQRP